MPIEENTYISELFLPCYTSVAKRILTAAFIYMFKNSKKKTNYYSIKWAYYPEFINEISPEGNLIVTNVYVKNSRINRTLNFIANQIKQMIENMIFFKPTDDYSIDEDDLKKFNNLDRTNVKNETKVLVFERLTSIRRSAVYRNSTTLTNMFGFGNSESRKKEDNFLTFTLKQAWILYFYLKNSQKKLSKYSNEEISEVVGEPRNPIEVEKIKLLNEKCNSISKKFEEVHAAFIKKQDDEVNKIRCKYRTKTDNFLDKIAKDIDKFIKEIDIKIE